MANSKLQAIWNHPAGPKTIHFWAPTFKWGVSIANIIDSSKPPEQLSYVQQSEELESFQCQYWDGCNFPVSTFT
ncbi:hypothetical protein PRUPE_3G207000 [Prunus persica]|uniref:Mitochondrial pyruvate carrier n=1 Tax=Prunus persica TaxID=3760 RepID=A0A251Q3G8_PRUPE|nr:hypothetical protein PRUPE_3G207000 [Prunus persica]